MDELLPKYSAVVAFRSGG